MFETFLIVLTVAVIIAVAPEQGKREQRWNNYVDGAQARWEAFKAAQQSVQPTAAGGSDSGGNSESGGG